MSKSKVLEESWKKVIINENNVSNTFKQEKYLDLIIRILKRWKLSKSTKEVIAFENWRFMVIENTYDAALGRWHFSWHLKFKLAFLAKFESCQLLKINGVILRSKVVYGWRTELKTRIGIYMKSSWKYKQTTTNISNFLEISFIIDKTLFSASLYSVKPTVHTI